VIGTNDKPIYLSGPESAHLTEDQHVSPGGNLTAQGDLVFTDVDLSDTHTVSTIVTASTSGGSTITLSNAALLAAMSTTLDDSTGHLLGDVDWNFALPNSEVNFLAAGETLTLNYNITVTDPAHASDTQTVTITVLGTNHPVVITSGPESASLAEQADTTGSPVLDTTTPVPTGTLSFSDPDLGDTHTVAVSIGSEVWSGGSGIPTATQSDLTTALATTLHDSTGSGTGGVDWTFSIPDQGLDFLAAGETLTVNYNVRVSDASTHATQTVSVTVTGANDAPVITSGPESASLAELPNTTGSSALDTTSPVPTATLNFTDPDLTDTHQVDVTLTSATWSVDPFFVASADFQTALTTTLHDSTGSGSGGVDWTFSIPDHDLDFLGAGETLTVTYDVAVSDAAVTSDQSVTITINGAEDPLVVNPAVATVIDTAFPDVGNVVASGNVISDASDSAGDASTTLSVTAVNGDAANVDSTIAGTYGSLFIDSSGFYFYVANSNIDPLQVGDNPTDQFNFTVTDSLGRSETTTLTFNVIGGDDAPTITAANASGSMTEDAGPTVVVNGGFETGDLTGWSASAGVQAQFLGFGGEFGNYAAQLAPSSGSISQDVATTPGEHYTLSFVVLGDPEATSNSLTVTWDGATVLSLHDDFGGPTQYTFDVVGDATHSTTPLVFSYGDDGNGLYLDQVTAEGATSPPTETAGGNIAFADIETGDTHTASFVPQDTGYVGAFSLDPVTEAPGSGSVNWHFTVDNSDIQFLSQGQSLTQDYIVSITDNHGASTTQDVTITINGSNDAPTATAPTIITDIDANGGIFIPGWALTASASDPDTADTLSVTNVGGGSGGGAFQSGGDALFFDDATLGGSFSYQVTDGIATTPAVTATVVNNPASTTTLTGTSGNDVLIATQGGEALNGGAGNDVLIGNGGSHILTGGTGDDIFAFQQTTDGPNTITDFNNTTEHDRIALSANGFGGGLTPGMDASPVFETSNDNTFQSHSSLFHFDTANHTLYYSPDGTTASEIALAQVQAGVVLHPQDLLIT
jgi:VCBS repeat-containing protein